MPFGACPYPSTPVPNCELQGPHALSHTGGPLPCAKAMYPSCPSLKDFCSNISCYLGTSESSGSELILARPVYVRTKQSFAGARQHTARYHDVMLSVSDLSDTRLINKFCLSTTYTQQRVKVNAARPGSNASCCSPARKSFPKCRADPRLWPRLLPSQEMQMLPKTLKLERFVAWTAEQSMCKMQHMLMAPVSEKSPSPSAVVLT